MILAEYKRTVGFFMMSLFILSGCNESSEPNENGQGSETGDSIVAENLIVSVDGERYVEFINEIKSEFEEEHDVVVEVNNTSMFDQLEAFPLDGPAGIGTDVMMAPYDRAGNLGQQGHLMELELADDGRYDEKSLSMAELNGNQYAAPFVVETVLMFYNLDLIDELPETFEDLEELSRDERFDFEGEEGTNVAFLANWVDFNQAYGLIAGYGGSVFGEEGQNPEDIGINSEGAIEGIEYITEWYQNVWPQGMRDTSSAGDFKNQSFTNGETAANIAGTWMTGDFRDAGINLGITSIPTLPNGEAYQPFAGGKGWIVSEYTEVPDIAQNWINYVTNDQNSQLFYEITSEVPVNNQSREIIIAEGEDELAIAVYDQFDTATPMPIIPEMSEVWLGTQNMLFDAVSGNKTAEEASNDAVEVIRSNIEEKY